MTDLIHEISAVEYMEHGDEQFHAATELTNRADATRDVATMFEARMVLITAAVFSGRSIVAIPAFAWCLQKYREDRDAFCHAEYALLWRFKWVLGAFADTYAIDQSKFHELRGQMAEMYQDCGYGLRTVHYKNFTNAIACGDRARAASAYEEFVSVPRDGMSDCAACEPDNVADYFDLVGEFERATTACQPILDGKLACAEVPERTHAKLLRSFAKQGRYDEGDRYQKLGYAATKRQRGYLPYFGLHIAYLIHRNRVDEAVGVFEENSGLLAESREPWADLRFLSAGELLLQVLDERSDRRRLQLAPSFSALGDVADGEFAAVETTVKNARAELAAKFDERNGSDFMSNEFFEGLRY